MPRYEPEKRHMRESLLFCFNLKKSAAESHRMLFEAYGDSALSETTCRDWFRRFKDGNFDLSDKDRENRPRKFQDEELQALLDADNTQTQQMLAEQLGVTHQAISDRLKAMGKVQKMGKWVPHELNERQQETRRAISEMLFERHNRKSFLHRIITGDEKWIYFENPKRTKSWVDPGQPSTSSPKPDRFGKKTMLCIWWDQSGVIYYELLKPGETVDAHRYHQQLIKLNQAISRNRPEYADRHEGIIFQHDNAPAHKSRLVQTYLGRLNWEILPHPPYSPDLAPSDYHLFASMGHALKEKHFTSYEDVQKWLDDWFAFQETNFFWRGIHHLPERWEKCVAHDGKYFE